ncbi:hypothetical protein G3V94_26555, partial [Escherichia coli]|nr:hypothetical protein [Escherichia coli]
HKAIRRQRQMCIRDSYSSLISSDKDLSYGLYDTKTYQFFSTSKNADTPALHGLIRQEDAFFRQGNRVYTVAHSAIRPIAVIMSTPYASYYQSFYDQVMFTLPLGGVCSILILLVWSRSRQQYHSPRNM